MEQRQKSLDLLQGLAKLTENMTSEEWDIYVKGLNLEEENEMGDKCKWVDGKFHPCDNFKVSFYIHDDGSIGYFCSSCHEGLQNSESELVVKESGNTWVARYNGIDYLDISGNTTQDDIVGMDFTNLEDISWWMPIKGLDITDEIAKLRPFIMYNGDFHILYGIDFEGDAVIGGGYALKSSMHLATVEDL